MKRRRKIFVAILGGAPLLALAAACTFPEVTFSNGTDGGVEGSIGTSSSGSIPGAEAGDGGGGSLVDDSGKTIDVVTRDDDASSVVDPAGCDARCDCDNDGYLDKAKSNCTKPTSFDDASATLLGDCDDLDNLVHPDQTYVDAVPRAGSAKPGDWNCDDHVDKGIFEDFACGGVATLCTDNGPNGKFDGPVACGAMGEIYDCVKGLGCTKTFRKTTKQVCK